MRELYCLVPPSAWEVANFWALLRSFHFLLRSSKTLKPDLNCPVDSMTGIPNLPSCSGPFSAESLRKINLREVPTSLPDCLVVEPIAATIPFN